DRGLRVAARGDLGDPARLAEGADERGRVARRRDQVDVRDQLLAPADAPRLRDRDRARMLEELLDDAPHRRQRGAEKAARLRLLLPTRGESAQDLLLAPLAHA